VVAEAENPVLLETRGVAKRYGPLWVLHGIDFSLARGESVALLGPNGAGKSTFLRILAGITRPSRGVVRWREGVASGKGPLAQRRRIGFVGHRSFLYGSLTVRENLTLYAGLYQVQDPQRRIQESLERFGLVSFRERRVAQLSRGLEQRAALARALLHKPEILLLDEPFTGLDAGATEALAALLHEEMQRGVSLVLATHDFAQAEALCRRVMVLARGTVGWDGSTQTPLAQLYREVVANVVRGQP
jgi:heme exporter protein A